MKSLIYGASQALEAQLEAKRMLDFIIQEQPRIDKELPQFGGLQRHWKRDRDMLGDTQPYAWDKDTTNAVLHASQSIPPETQLNTANLGVKGIFWHFEECLPWQTQREDGDTGVRAICMAQIDLAQLFRKGTETRIVEHFIQTGKVHKDDLHTLEPVPIYGVSCWCDSPLGIKSYHPIWPSQTFQWRLNESLESMLKYADIEHERTYGPGGRYYDHAQTHQIISKDRFLEAAEGVARFILAGLVWIQQKIVTSDIQHIERHARKRAKKELGHEPELRLVQLRRTEPKKKESTEGGEKVEWSRRWMVDDYWRNQRVGPGLSQTRLTWVRPHVKGPEDKPLILPKPKVFIVNR